MKWIAAALLLVLLPAAAVGDEVVARVGTREITATELERGAWERLLDAKTIEFEVERRVLQELIEAELLAAEARRRGLAVPELLKREVEAKAASVSVWDVRAAYQRDPARYQGMAEADALRLAEARLRADREAQRRFGFLSELRAAAGVTTALRPPRVAIEPGRGAVRGPADAAVTIVEFSDFECPFCGRAAVTLRRLLANYPGKLRLVYRHFPSERHRSARKAAEAAECAADQGRFWELHDRLLADQGDLGVGALRAHATALGLDAARFRACLDSGQKVERWREDEAAVKRLGLSGTPLFLINGRLLLGAQPYAVFARIVEEELGGPSLR